MVKGRRRYADGNGVETPARMQDLIDVGVLSGKKDEEKPMLCARSASPAGADV